MTTLRSILMGCAERELEHGRPTVDDLVACAFRDHADVFAAESERLIRNAARNEAKDILRRLFDDEGGGDQLALPGLRLPTAIAVRCEDGSIYYVRSDRATWDELVAGREERARHVIAAQLKLQSYDESLDRLRPLMTGEDAASSVADALRRERDLAAAS